MYMDGSSRSTRLLETPHEHRKLGVRVATTESLGLMHQSGTDVRPCTSWHIIF